MRHVTSLNQGLSSTTPSCGKTKDPGNEVDMMGGRRTFEIYIATVKHDYLLFADSD